ncbi:MAG: type VII toxin-antitoxin system HepT family RNase toxin [Gemmatimonadota bacterium]
MTSSGEQRNGRDPTGRSHGAAEARRYRQKCGSSRGIEGLTLEEYIGDFFRLKGTERALQETVEAAVDINLHILRDRDAKTPLDYFESFIAVGREKVIPSQLAESLPPSAGLRNRIIHEYENIDDGIILQAVGKAREVFPRYVAAIEQYLKRRFRMRAVATVWKTPIYQKSGILT